MESEQTDKHTVYAEEFPTTIARIHDMSRADQLYTALQDSGLAVDARPALFSAKQHERLYQQTDTHWNDRGALVDVVLQFVVVAR